MNFIRSLCLAASACLLTGVASAAPVSLHLTLTKAIQLAMEKNLALKVEAFTPQIAEAQVMSEKGIFDPSLDLGFLHDQNPNGGSGVRSRTGGFTSGISGNTALGSSYSFGLSTQAYNYSGYRSGAALGLTQPLLRGFGTDVNLASLRIAGNNRQISEWTFRSRIIDVVTETVYAYNELYSAIQNSEAARRSRDAALQLEKEEQRRAELGVKTPLDVTTARSAAAAREESVILAESAIRESQRILKQLVTDDTQTLLATEISIEPPPTLLVGRVDVEGGIGEALRQRPDYQQALVDLKNRRINVVVAHNQTLPRLDLSASLNLLGVTENDFASSFGFVGNGDQNPSHWGAGVVLRIPLGNRYARGQYAASKLVGAQALVGLQQMEQAIIVRVANAADQITTSHQRIDTTREAVRLAKESLAAGEQRLKEGVATAFEVLELQRKLAETEAAQIRSEGDYRKAVAEYDRQTGTTLERNAITFSCEESGVTQIKKAEKTGKKR